MFKVLFVGKGTITVSLAGCLNDQGWKVQYHRHSMGPMTEVDCAQYDYVVSCMPDAQVASEVWGDLLISALRHNARNTVFVEMSTLTKIEAVSINKAFCSETIKFIEAPFTGSKQGALSGSLVYFCFSNTVLPDLDVYLKSTSKKIYTFDSPGAATQFKLFYNLWGLTSLGLLGQMLHVMRSLPQSELARQIIKSHPEFWMGTIAKDKLDQSLNREFDDVHCKLKYAKKDIRYAINEFSEYRLDLSKTLLSVLEHEKVQIDDGLDFTSMCDFFK